MSIDMNQLRDAQGRDVHSQDGDKIGSVSEIFYDDETGQPKWFGLGTGFFGNKRVLVPVETATMSGDSIQVPYAKDHVKGAPDIDGDHISKDTERDLYSYYSLDYGARSTEARYDVDTSGDDVSSRDVDRTDRGGDRSLTRSEEELRVGKERASTGTARLRKWVETEPVSTTVGLERETAHVHREPIDTPVGHDIELGEREIEVPLHEERAVVEKQVVGKERVSIDTDTEVEQHTVSDEVRKERVEIEGDTTRDRDRLDRES